MPTCGLCVAAKGIVRDAQNNTISIFSILENITPSGFPVFIQDIGVLTVWKKSETDPPEIDLTFRIVNNQREVITGPLRINFHEGLLHRSIISLSGVIVHEPGQLSFLFNYLDQTLARYDVAVSTPSPQVTQVTPSAG